MQRIPGITKMMYMFAETLTASITQKALANVPVGVFADTFTVSHTGDAICELESQFDNNDMLDYYSSINCEKIYLAHGDMDRKLAFKPMLEDAISKSSRPDELKRLLQQ